MILTIDMGNYSNIVIGGIDDSPAPSLWNDVTHKPEEKQIWNTPSTSKASWQIHNVPVSSIEGRHSFLRSYRRSTDTILSAVRENLWLFAHACRLWHENWSEHHHG